MLKTTGAPAPNEDGIEDAATAPLIVNKPDPAVQNTEVAMSAQTSGKLAVARTRIKELETQLEEAATRLEDGGAQFEAYEKELDTYRDKIAGLIQRNVEMTISRDQALRDRIEANARAETALQAIERMAEGTARGLK